MGYLETFRDNAIFDTKLVAKGDGVNDDAPLINSLIANTPPGSLIYFSPPPNFYGVGSIPLILLPNRTYVGSIGYFNGDLIKQLAGANLPAVVCSSDWYNNTPAAGFPIRMYNISVNGNSANNVNSHGIAHSNFNSIFEGCSATFTPAAGILTSANTRNGSLISNGLVQTRIRDCVVTNNGTNGISIADSSHGKVTDGYLENCESSVSTLDNIIFDTAGGWKITGNHVSGGQQSGITVSHCFDTLINDNYVDGFGFNASAPPGTFYNGLYAGILAGSVTIVSNNRVTSNATVANTTYEFVSVQSTDTTGDNKVSVYGNDCFGANVANQNAFAIDGHLTPTRNFIVNDWNNAALNFPAANLYSLNGTNLVFNPLQSQNPVKPNNSSTLFSGTGVPASTLGANGDYYLRTDTPGTVNQRLYVKSAGAWSGIL